MRATLAYFRDRFCERSTYMLLVASVGSVAGLPRPFNWLGFVALVFAALTPDGTVNS